MKANAADRTILVTGATGQPGGAGVTGAAVGVTELKEAEDRGPSRAGAPR